MDPRVFHASVYDKVKIDHLRLLLYSTQGYINSNVVALPAEEFLVVVLTEEVLRGIPLA